VRCLHFGGPGSTRALTNAFEGVRDAYAYSAFGVTETSMGSSVNSYRFYGQWGYYDDSTFVEVPTPTHPTPLEPRNTDDPKSPMAVGCKPTSHQW